MKTWSQKTQMEIWRLVSCWISKATRLQAHASVRTPTPTHACTRTYARPRAPVTHTDTQKYITLRTATVASQTRLRLPCRHIACLVIIEDEATAVFRKVGHQSPSTISET